MSNSTASWIPGFEEHRLLHLRRGTHLAANAGPEELALGKDGVHSVHVGERPITFTALDGTVMVTCEGDWDDHVLWPGQSYTSERPGHHVVAALRPARVRIA